MKKLDLNLILALDTLLATRSVSRAAERLNLSQPAMSAALARLRAYFDDDLLLQVGKRMVPTAFAESLAPLAAEILNGVATLVATSPDFDPAISRRVFRIATSDYVSLVIVAPLLRRLRYSAPHVGIDIIHLSADLAQRLDSGEIDLVVAPASFVSPIHPARLLFEENHVVVGCKDNPIFDEPLTTEAFLSLGQVAALVGSPRAASYAEMEMDRMGMARRIEVRTASFLAVPWLLPHTFRVAVMHERLARAMLPTLPLRMAPLPFEIKPMPEMLQYHRTRQSDLGLKWLAQALDDVAAERDPSLLCLPSGLPPEDATGRLKQVPRT